MIKRGDVLQAACRPWGDDEIEVEMPCCRHLAGKRARQPRRSRVWLKSLALPDGGRAKCPNCGWYYRVTHGPDARHVTLTA